MNKHSGSSPSNCPLCWDAIEERKPDESSESFLAFAKAQRRKHFAAIRRRANDDAMRSIGLKKVRGSVSGKTYWE